MVRRSHLGVPTPRYRYSIKMKARVARRPALDRPVFVGGVELLVGGRLAIDETQEFQPFLMAMALHAEWATLL
jgi:hypothetical protein